MRALAPFLIFAILVVALALGLRLNPSLVDSPLIGKPMPVVSGADLIQPEHFVHTQDWQGQVSLVNVWASWCIACLDEHPLLMRIAQSRLLPVFGMNYKDKRSDALNWLDEQGNPYQMILHDEDGKAGIEWGVYGVPETYLIDAQGIIRSKKVGAIDEAFLDEHVLPLLEATRKQRTE